MTSELTAGSESGTRIWPGGFILNKLKFDVNPSDASAAGGGGSDQAALTSRHENRWVGIANLDFQADQYNRLKVRLGRQLPTR